MEKLTVFFEEPFWVGVFERMENSRLSVAKFTFGAEPKDAEVYEWILKHYTRLWFSPAVTACVKEDTRNPKRRQRDIRKQLQHTGIGTKSQQALKLQKDQSKQERKAQRRERKQADAQRLFALKQQKKRDKHRGH